MNPPPPVSGAQHRPRRALQMVATFDTSPQPQLRPHNRTQNARLYRTNIKFYLAKIKNLGLFRRCGLDLDPMTFICEVDRIPEGSRRPEINCLRQAFGSYVLHNNILTHMYMQTYRQTDRRHCKRFRVASRVVKSHYMPQPQTNKNVIIFIHQYLVDEK